MFSKAPKRKGNASGQTTVKRAGAAKAGPTHLFGKTEVVSDFSARRADVSTHRFKAGDREVSGNLQPMIFITIDPSLEKAEINSPLSSKAEAAIKMFSIKK